MITPSCPSHFSLSLSTFPPLRSPRIPAGQAPEGQEPRPRQGCGAPWWSHCRRRSSQTALCVQVSERSCEAALSVARLLVIASFCRGIHSPYAPLPLTTSSSAWSSSLQFFVCILLFEVENFINMCVLKRVQKRVLISQAFVDLMRSRGDAHPLQRSLSPHMLHPLHLRGS